MPLLAYSSALDGLWWVCWGAISLLTTLIYAYLYTRTFDPLMIPFVPGFIQTVSIRNALFALATLIYLFNWFKARRRKPLPALPTGRETRPLFPEEW